MTLAFHQCSPFVPCLGLKRFKNRFPSISTTDYARHFIDVQLNYFVRLALDLLAECKKNYNMMYIVKIKTMLIVKEKSGSELLKRWTALSTG